MMITTESMKEGFHKLKALLIKQFSKILDWLEKALLKAAKKEKNRFSKIKPKMLRMIARAKAGLSKSKALNEQNPELAKRLKDESELLQEEIEHLHDIIMVDGKKMNRDEYKEHIREEELKREGYSQAYEEEKKRRAKERERERARIEKENDEIMERNSARMEEQLRGLTDAAINNVDKEIKSVKKKTDKLGKKVNKTDKSIDNFGKDWAEDIIDQTKKNQIKWDSEYAPSKRK